MRRSTCCRSSASRSFRIVTTETSNTSASRLTETFPSASRSSRILACRPMALSAVIPGLRHRHLPDFLSYSFYNRTIENFRKFFLRARSAVFSFRANRSLTMNDAAAAQPHMLVDILRQAEVLAGLRERFEAFATIGGDVLVPGPGGALHAFGCGDGWFAAN